MDRSECYHRIDRFRNRCARKLFQIPRMEFESQGNKFQAHRDEIQLPRNKIQPPREQRSSTKGAFSTSCADGRAAGAADFVGSPPPKVHGSRYGAKPATGFDFSEAIVAKNPATDGRGRPRPI